MPAAQFTGYEPIRLIAPPVRNGTRNDSKVAENQNELASNEALLYWDSNSSVPRCSERRRTNSPGIVKPSKKKLLRPVRVQPRLPYDGYTVIPRSGHNRHLVETQINTRARQLIQQTQATSLLAHGQNIDGKVPLIQQPWPTPRDRWYRYLEAHSLFAELLTSTPPLVWSPLYPPGDRSSFHPLPLNQRATNPILRGGHLDRKCLSKSSKKTNLRRLLPVQVIHKEHILASQSHSSSFVATIENRPSTFACQ